MKNNFLPMIKKAQLTVKLAQNDTLFLLKKIQSWRLYYLIGKMFADSQEEDIENVYTFLEAENNPLLWQIFNQALACPEVFGEQRILLPKEEKVYLDKEPILRQAVAEEDVTFFKKIISDVVLENYPQLQEELSDYIYISEKYMDMRLYAAEIENLYEKIANNDKVLPLEIDWGSTRENTLCVNCPPNTVFGAKLNPMAQENLLNLMAWMFFEQSIFIASFSGICSDSFGKINFVDFDRVYTVDEALREFLFEYLEQRKEPQTFAERKLVLMIKYLETYCPELNITYQLLEISKTYPHQLPEQKEQSTSSKMEKALTEQGLSLLSNKSPQTESNVLQKHQMFEEFKNGNSFRKSSWRYYIPLLLVIYALLKFFG